jgi:hypothetical protein
VAELDDAFDECYNDFIQAIGAGVKVESGAVGEDGVANAALRREVARDDVGLKRRVGKLNGGGEILFLRDQLLLAGDKRRSQLTTGL